MNHSKKCARKEAFEPPTYRKLERGFGKTSKYTPRGMNRGRADNQEITGVREQEVSKLCFSMVRDHEDEVPLLTECSL